MGEPFSNKPFFRALFFILAFIICFLWIALSGCYTERKGVKQSVRAYSDYPGAIAALHSVWFPIRDSIMERIVYRPGAVRYRYDTVTVDCDSASGALTKETSSLPVVKKIRIPCPPCAISIDTVEHYREVSRERSSKIEAINARMQSLLTELTKKEKTITKYQTLLNVSLWTIVLIGGYTIIRLILRAWLKINIP